MSGDNIQRQIEFLLEHQAKISADIEQHSEQIRLLTNDVQSLASTIDRIQEQMETDRVDTREVLNSVIAEMREGFNKLILSNEVTRDLASKVASLEVQTSQRVTGLERRVTDLES
ncbi:MAG: hypothetical protein ACLGJB_21715 [Blastocatellia bacterium]